ncbi:allophanate hydrolase [Alicycliphilus denitrificans]|mgnify:CR=1 FL=1|uniref:5-oxoprolinase subunit PxpB n=1 Tax=Alicycliphilus denitrificans TaxID=179636 RepID=UPI0001D9E7BF|nr:5-oxoprolinase subunit PxpB [Alicycliphilus denitrificans]OJW91538.1 MAG: allophanate hydrolase [Alicycliphilus sp. 69-12]GAO20371.1 allophanate hydrolase subunit 1 [Alicycliphilus sp. B1]ADU98769.1 Allophanate hydrolase subunit 1 [Alicycliphilus denitrificans BC]MBN9572437.1 5-oxoprolinase subunit PxpB [Alicycliphilus denitrificans]BCN37801.1 allophanate hydrolase [Alicycliphilus denitrificans]
MSTAADIAQAAPRLAVSALGTDALLFESLAPLSHEAQERILMVADQASQWRGVEEAVPGMNNLMLIFDSTQVSSAEMQSRVQQAWLSPVHVRRKAREFELPVVYGGERGLDLEHVAAHNGISVADVIELHSSAIYTVYFLGAHPGFAYLGGLDARLHTPRRAQPRLKVPAGSVSIGGAQAGVQAQTLPSGWNLIGHTDRRFFDPASATPALLAPGDIVRFRAVKALP